MRITNSMGYQNLLQDLAQVQERMRDAQLQVSSGKRILKPSDDPSVTSDVIRLNSEKGEAGQYDRNLTFAETKLTFTDTVLDGVQTVIERVRSLGQASFGNAIIAGLNTTEVRSLRDQLISAANSTHAGRFLFGGSITDAPPYLKAADSSVSYQGNSEYMPLQVSRTSTLQTQIPGSEIFTGSVDIFATLSDMITAMEAGDKAGIDTALKQIDQFWEDVAIARSKVGSYINIAANFKSELTSARLARENDLSKQQAADLAQSITEFNLSEGALRATLAIGSRISQLSILDFLQ